MVAARKGQCDSNFLLVWNEKIWKSFAYKLRFLHIQYFFQFFFKSNVLLNSKWIFEICWQRRFFSCIQSNLPKNSSFTSFSSVGMNFFPKFLIFFGESYLCILKDGGNCLRILKKDWLDLVSSFFLLFQFIIRNKKWNKF